MTKTVPECQGFKVGDVITHADNAFVTERVTKIESPTVMWVVTEIVSDKSGKPGEVAR
jgi:hypothetical protein